MTNHPNRTKHADIRKHLKDKSDVERVKFFVGADEWHCYGRMPNSIERGWWFAGHTADVEREMQIEQGS